MEVVSGESCYEHLDGASSVVRVVCSEYVVCYKKCGASNVLQEVWSEYCACSCKKCDV
jgi:hypothetical protein